MYLVEIATGPAWFWSANGTQAAPSTVGRPQRPRCHQAGSGRSREGGIGHVAGNGKPATARAGRVEFGSFHWKQPSLEEDCLFRRLVAAAAAATSATIRDGLLWFVGVTASSGVGGCCVCPRRTA
jgi:hypothetical protein